MKKSFSDIEKTVNLNSNESEYPLLKRCNVNRDEKHGKISSGVGNNDIKANNYQSSTASSINRPIVRPHVPTGGNECYQGATSTRSAFYPQQPVVNQFQSHSKHQLHSYGPQNAVSDGKILKQNQRLPALLEDQIVAAYNNISAEEKQRRRLVQQMNAYRVHCQNMVPRRPPYYEPMVLFKDGNATIQPQSAGPSKEQEKEQPPQGEQYEELQETCCIRKMFTSEWMKIVTGLFMVMLILIFVVALKYTNLV